MMEQIRTTQKRPRRKITGAQLDVINVAWPLFERSALRFARLLTRDLDEQDDLLAEAQEKLSDLDPTRFSLLEDAAVRYLSRALINHMFEIYPSIRNHTDGDQTVPADVVARFILPS